jgi:hypothetical protein
VIFVRRPKLRAEAGARLRLRARSPGRRLGPELRAGAGLRLGLTRLGLRARAGRPGGLRLELELEE